MVGVPKMSGDPLAWLEQVNAANQATQAVKPDADTLQSGIGDLAAAAKDGKDAMASLMEVLAMFGGG